MTLRNLNAYELSIWQYLVCMLCSVSLQSQRLYCFPVSSTLQD